MYNKIIIAGNLGKDPTMKYQPNGTAVTNFSVATNRSWKDKITQEWVNETTWFRVTTWGKTAEYCNEHLSRGNKVIVEGRLKCDPQSGGPRVFVRHDGTAGASFEIADAKVTKIRESNNQTQPATAAATAQDEADDIPF